MKKIEELVDPSGIILTKNVMDAGISKYSLYSFLEQSSFEQVGWGILCFSRSMGRWTLYFVSSLPSGDYFS